jgi:hypothetical protein
MAPTNGPRTPASYPIDTQGEVPLPSTRTLYQDKSSRLDAAKHRYAPRYRSNSPPRRCRSWVCSSLRCTTPPSYAATPPPSAHATTAAQPAAPAPAQPSARALGTRGIHGAEFDGFEFAIEDGVGSVPEVPGKRVVAHARLQPSEAPPDFIVLVHGDTPTRSNPMRCCLPRNSATTGRTPYPAPTYLAWHS